MKSFLISILCTVVFVGTAQQVKSQTIVLDLANRKLSDDGLHWSFDLMGKGNQGYGGAANGLWTAFSISIDLALPPGVTITGGSGVGSPTHASASVAVQTSIVGSPPPGSGQQELGLSLERSDSDQDLTNSDFVKLASYTINFSSPVSPNNPAFPRPIPNLPGSSWVNSADENLLRPFEFTQANYTLPVKLVKFDITKEGGVSNLSWSTSEETNSDRFDVQRSKDGKKWAIIETVKAVGESTTTHSYSAVDNNPLSGENLYRLHMIDKDGTSSFSMIRTLSFDIALTAVFPNPASDLLSFNTPDFDKIQRVSLVNSNGISVYESASKPQCTIDISKFHPGVYVVRIKFMNGEENTFKVLIAR